MLLEQQIDEILLNAYREDITYNDITSDTLIDEKLIVDGKLIAKESGIVSGIKVFERAFTILDEDIEFDFFKDDGDEIIEGDLICTLKGKARSILKAERTALNLIQRMSGISTLTHKMVKIIQGTKAKLVDTRKTVPGLRIIDKYAVKVGGGYNHRFNLSDAVMIKDNHIKAAGSIKEALLKAKENIPHTMKIEIEVETIEQLEEALKYGADIIMLDNMDYDTMKKSVEIAKNKVIVEASGNVTIENIREVALTGVDIISCGTLTHSVKALDISLRLS